MSAPAKPRRRVVRPAVCGTCGASFMARVDTPGRFHSNKCATQARRGAANNKYNGGLCFSGGRWLIVYRDGSSSLYSRAVMAGRIGRLLTPAEIVHHKDEDPTNDEPENLQIVTRAEHIELHRDQFLAARGIYRAAA